MSIHETEKTKEVLWWKKPLRVIQYNLQVKDTDKMIPEKIAQETEDMAANTVVINMGGIYAWYPSKIKYHHVNEYLPKDHDLMKELIESFHAHQIKVIARFDFSQVEDKVYLEKPQWFVQDNDKNPMIRGKDRLGEWSMLMTTCINAGYRNEEAALPILKEAIENYDIDGIFFNAPHARECHCDICKAKYREKYHQELPERIFDFEKKWMSDCYGENIRKMYALIKSLRPDMPLVLYYSTFDEISAEYSVIKDDLRDRTATADMIITEAQNVLSKGKNNIPQAWKPALSMKFGNLPDHYPHPFGCIHTCPGMDWRHTGMPDAEHKFWLSQVPANQAYIWHSLTGFNDTIGDKRLLDSVAWVNKSITKCEMQMDGAVSLAQTLLIWDSSPAAMGWAEGLINTQQQFDLMNDVQLDLEKMRKYPVVIIPSSFKTSTGSLVIFKSYVEQGGHLIIESTDPDFALAMKDLLGIQGVPSQSGYLSASYICFEQPGKSLKSRFEDAEILPLRGKVLYCEPAADTKVMMTLIPPFAPLDAVGAPPERASMLVKHTDIPLCLENDSGQGTVMFLPFELSMLATEYRFGEFYHLMQNCVDYYLGDDKQFTVDGVNGLQATVYEKGDQILVHFVNGIGQRPLADNIPLYHLKFKIKLPANRSVQSIHTAISDQDVPYTEKDGFVYADLNKLDIWDMIEVNLNV